MPRAVVIDASVVLRFLLRGSPEAATVIGSEEVAAPTLIAAETANGLVKEMRFADLSLDDARTLLEAGLALPIELVPDRALAADTLAIAQHLSLSAYDAAYVALAERMHAPLVTADRRLAGRYPRSELVP